jgi:hypothetical protein
MNRMAASKRSIRIFIDSIDRIICTMITAQTVRLSRLDSKSHNEGQDNRNYGMGAGGVPKLNVHIRAKLSVCSRRNSRLLIPM